MPIHPHGMRTWRFSWRFRRIHRILNRAPDSSFSIFLAMTAPGGKLASVTATASFPNLSRLGRAVASDSVVMCARLHAECASTPPSDARGDFPPGAYAPVPPVTSRKTRLRSDCSSSLNAWQFSMPLSARKTNTGERASSIAPVTFSLQRLVRTSSQYAQSRRAWYFDSMAHCLRTASAKYSTPCPSSIGTDEAW